MKLFFTLFKALRLAFAVACTVVGILMLGHSTVRWVANARRFS